MTKLLIFAKRILQMGDITGSLNFGDKFIVIDAAGGTVTFSLWEKQGASAFLIDQTEVQNDKVR